MSNSNRWSTASAPCRLEWRPSRWLVGALLLLGLLAAAAALASEMPRVVAAPLALLAAGHALASAMRAAREPHRKLTWPGEGAVTIDGDTADDVSLRWRGPLAFLCWRQRGGPVQRLVWWPDTLDSRSRRELRLASDRHAASRRAPRMAG